MVSYRSSPSGPRRLAIAGAGLVGRRHAAAIDKLGQIELVAIADPSDAGREFAMERGLPHFDAVEPMLASHQIDGVILSTPTPLHLTQGLTCISQGLPTLIEKPLAVTAQDARQLAEASACSGVPVLVGHHRRHNPVIQKAQHLISQGRIGQVRALNAQCWFYKPDEYFDIAPWRKQAGAGPVLVNLVHDIDLLRYLCGEIVTVQAQALPSTRGFENEEAAAMVVRFDNGAVGTISVADSVVSPWSWELTSGEYPVYPKTNESCYRIGGSHGALSIPDLTIWSHGGQRDWWSPISATHFPRSTSDPLVNQLAHFVDVIDGQADPLVSAMEGYLTMQVIECMSSSALTGETVIVPRTENCQNAA